MRKGGFRFAVVLSLALAATAVAVALTYHLPLRDPDGVAVPTYVRLPDHPAAGLPHRRGPAGRLARPRRLVRFPRALVAVVRERWRWEHTRFALVGLGAWYLTYAAFRNLKSFVPFVNREPVGRHPGEVRPASSSSATTRPPCCTTSSATGWAAQFFSLVYVAWIVLRAGHPGRRAGVVARPDPAASGTSPRSPSTGCWASRRTSWCPTLGPVYAQPRDFAALPHTYVSTLQEAMIHDRHTVLYDPFATHAVQTIAAFASLHVGIMVTVCLMARLLGLQRWVRWSPCGCSWP